MATVLDTLRTKLGIPGKRKYETTTKSPAFANMSLKDKLQSIAMYIRTVNREQSIRQNTQHYLLALYYAGHQNVDFNAAGASFDIYEDFYVENQFRKHVDTVVQILNRMEGDIIVRPASDSPRDIATARVADHVLDLMRDSIGYEKLRDQKNLYKCLFGTAYMFNDYVVSKKYGTIVTPKFSYEDRPDADGEMVLSKVVNGYETRNRGKEISAVCSPLEVKTLTDCKGGLEAVPFLQWKGLVDLDMVNYQYPGLNEGATSDSGSDMSSEYLEVLGNMSSSLLGDSGGLSTSQSRTNKAELARTWIQPCMFRGDKELEREFPNGVHVTSVNGRVIDWYGEDLTDRWTHEVLIPLPHSLTGDGLYDAILMQDQINEINSLLIQHMRYTVVGHKMYDASVFDAKDVVNDPASGWIPGKPGVDKTIRESVVDLAPGQLSGDVPGWLSTVKQAMQDMTSAYDPVTGKGIGANTPYSQSVFLSERAQSRWQGSLSYNRPELIRFHRQLLSIARDNWIDMRTRSVMDNTGRWSFQQFSQADLQGQVDITLSNTDFKPRSRAEQIQGLQMLQTLAPLLPAMPPKQKLRIEEMLGLPPDANPMNNQISRAYRNIDRIRRGEVVTPLPLVDDASLQCPVFQDFLVSEEGEALAESEPEAYANIYTFMITLAQMAIAQQGGPAGVMLAGIMGGGAKTLPDSGGPPAPAQKNMPGGQMGQPGGGNPNPGGQAQSPAVAPPIPPPSA